jgi:hypothetical protein
MFRQLLTAFNHTGDEALSMLAKDGSTVVIRRDGKRVSRKESVKEEDCRRFETGNLPCLALHCIGS